ncbi:CU044_5270 family protein [Streptomyces sp. NPDC057638]|uniref:CU044_5270 family protein n=1 Tax=Streptomyces sp. NPDC057638 TaxID=3346190 RepID=UPI00369C206E
MNPYQRTDGEQSEEVRAERERAERAQAACLLPPATPPDLSPDRLRARRRHLLAEIDREHRPARFRLPARRLVLALGAVAAAGAVVAALTLPGDTDTTDTTRTPPATAASVRLLERAALAADAVPVPVPPVRGDQFTYVRTAGHTTVLSENKDGGMDRLRQDEAMEQWTSVNGRDRTMQRKRGEDRLLPGTPGKGRLNAPTYAFLAALPTTPRALLDLIYADAEKNHGAGSDSTTGPDQQAFITIGDLLRTSVAPPGTTAALYRAAALIPGVTTVPDAVDAVGRPGVAVARTHDGERTEWIFDRRTVRMLGERTVLTRDSSWGAAGAVVTSVARMDSGVVDRAGQVP